MRSFFYVFNIYSLFGFKNFLAQGMINLYIDHGPLEDQREKAEPGGTQGKQTKVGRHKQ